MKLFFLLNIAMIIAFNMFAQDNQKIENLKLNYSEGKLIVSYDLPVVEKNTQYIIRLDVTAENGEKLIPKTIMGDVGANIFAGKYKRIEWDILKDGVEMAGNIAVIVEGEIMTEGLIEKVSMGKALFQSTILPGWGIFSTGGKKSTIFIGIAGYASLASSVFINSASVASYAAYKDELTNAEESENLFELADKQKKVSRFLGVSALAIWGVSYIYTFVKVKEANRPKHGVAKMMDDGRIQLVSQYEPATQAQSFGVKLIF